MALPPVSRWFTFLSPLLTVTAAVSVVAASAGPASARTALAPQGAPTPSAPTPSAPTGPAPSGQAPPSARAPVPGTSSPSGPAALVNPFIGSRGGGNESPGAHAPFGMVTWGPDTAHGGKGSGYEYGDATIDGFSLTHLAGVGCAATGEVPVLPEVGRPSSSATETMATGTQRASPGYYAVSTTDSVRTQLTATTRTGLAEVTFPQNQQASLVLKLSGDGAPGLAKVSSVTYRKVSPTEVRGSVTAGDFCGAHNSYTVYFDMRFSQQITSYGTYAGSTLHPGVRHLAVHGAARPAAHPVPPGTPEQMNSPVFHGTPPTPAAPAVTTPSGAYLGFGDLTQPLLVRVGLSYVSEAGAQANLVAEQGVTSTGADSFAALQSAATAAWNSQLGKIQVRSVAGQRTAEQTVFYTALYHALCFPTVFSDVNGAYLGMDGRVHSVAAGHAFYTNFSGWDIYRTQAQLLALLDPQVAGDVARSMLAGYAQGGELPKWVEYGGETHVMVGDPADAILGDLWSFGAVMSTATARQALADMVSQATYATLNRPGLNYQTSPGYLPINGSYCGDCNYYAPVTSTLEYATDDFAISALAGDLGQTAIQQKFLSRAQDWQNLLNPATGFVQARTVNGAWLAKGSPPTSSKGMAEGDSWQYTGMVPFNVAGLAAAKGGDAAMVTYLDKVLSGFRGGRNSRVSAMGNEPSIGLPWEYDYVGEPYQTQAKVRAVQKQIWKDAPGGLAGNDDLGTMSAWFVWSALGMYPMTPGTPVLALGSPLFATAAITLPGGGTLTIDGTGATATDGTTLGTPYVQSATWIPAGGSAQAWNSAQAPASAITAGGTLSFALGASPATRWAASAPPPSYPAPGRAAQAGRIVSGVGTDLCVDDSGSRTANGNKIDVYGCNGSRAQWWTVRTNGKIQVLGKCLSPARHTRRNGVGAVLATCTSSKWQRWRPGAGAGMLVNVRSGRCLGDPGASRSNGTRLKIWACGPGARQRWAMPYGSPPPPVGKVRSGLRGKCAEDSGGKTRAGNKVVIAYCNGGSAQRWIAEPDGTVHSVRGANGCLEVKHGAVAPGSRIAYFPCENTPGQQWRPQPGGTLLNPVSGLCLDASRTASGARLILAVCTGAKRQVFRLP